MNIIDVIKTHQSVNCFSNRPVDSDKIDSIVKATFFSSVGTDKVPFKTVIVSKDKIKRKIRQAAEKIEKAYQHGAVNGNESNDSAWKKPFLEEAPSLIVICSLSGQPYKAATTWLTVGNLLRAASKEGVGVICYAPSMPTFLRKILNISMQYIPIAIVSLGYPADELFPRYNSDDEKMFKNLFTGRFNWQNK